VSPTEAVDMDSLGSIGTPPEAQIEGDPVEQTLGEGMASFYGSELAGRRTASGERFDPGELTAAHRTLPFGSKVRVTNPANGRSVVVRINDRGPFARGRLIDLSRSAAKRIGLVGRGKGEVRLALLGG
jgi:rare lipoprotein A